MTKQGADLKKMYDKIAERVKVGSKFSWYQYVEKLTKVFYRLKQKNEICGNIKTLTNGGKKITIPNKINLNLKSFVITYFKKI